MTAEGPERDVDEQGLIAGAQRGDTEAFGRLALRHRSHVRSLLDRLGGAADLDDREQEVFLSAWKGIRRFRGDASFKTWISRIAIRRAKRAPGRSGWIRSVDHVEKSATPANPDSDRGLFRRESEHGLRLRSAVEALSPKLRVSFLLRYVEGMKSEEIGRVLKVSPGTVRSRLHLARVRLGEILGEEIVE